MPVEKRVLYTCTRELLVEVRVVGALGQPRAARFATDHGLERAHAERELWEKTFARGEHSGPVDVCRRAGQKLEISLVPVANERVDDTPVVAQPDLVRHREVLTIECDDGRKSRIPVGAHGLLFYERTKASDVLLEAGPQEVVREHGRERRREAHRDGERDTVGVEAVEGIDQREVTFEEGLVEPSFFEVTFVLRVAHVWQVGMKHEGEVTLGHARSIRDLGLAAR